MYTFVTKQNSINMHYQKPRLAMAHTPRKRKKITLGGGEDSTVYQVLSLPPFTNDDIQDTTHYTLVVNDKP